MSLHEAYLVAIEKAKTAPVTKMPPPLAGMLIKPKEGTNLVQMTAEYERQSKAWIKASPKARERLVEIFNRIACGYGASMSDPVFVITEWGSVSKQEGKLPSGKDRKETQAYRDALLLAFNAWAESLEIEEALDEDDDKGGGSGDNAPPTGKRKRL
jgi:hypothetical protein